MLIKDCSVCINFPNFLSCNYRKEFGWTTEDMALYEVVFCVLGISGQFIAVPVLTNTCHVRDSTLGALAWLTVSFAAVIMALAAREWLIWVAVTGAFLELTITPSIRSNISKVVGPFEVGAVFSILATFSGRVNNQLDMWLQN